MEAKSYKMGDLLYHPTKRYGSKYAVVVSLFDKENLPEHPMVKLPAFGIIWLDIPGDVYEFENAQWCETEKGFQLMAQSK